MINYVLIVIYAVFSVLWLIMFSKGEKFRGMIAPLKEGHPLKELYLVGFGILDTIKYSYNTALDTKRLAQAKIVYGERFGEYYYRVSVAEKVSYISLCVVISPLLGVLAGNPMISLFGLFAAGIMYYYVDSKITDVINAREYSIMKDFSDSVSKMALLINAGMITREAWEDIAQTGDGVLYQEMRQAVLDIQNGMSEVDAYIAFSNRCGVTYIKKFISMLIQNISKGNKELTDFLKAETTLAWEEKKHLVKREGEKASNKMMIPLGLILVGIFIMILVPVVANFSF